MSIIPTRIHGIVDYVVGIVLIAAPWIFQFNDVSAAKWTAIGVGAAIIVYGERVWARAARRQTNATPGAGAQPDPHALRFLETTSGERLQPLPRGR